MTSGELNTQSNVNPGHVALSEGGSLFSFVFSTMRLPALFPRTMSISAAPIQVDLRTQDVSSSDPRSKAQRNRNSLQLNQPLQFLVEKMIDSRNIHREICSHSYRSTPAPHQPQRQLYENPTRSLTPAHEMQIRCGRRVVALLVSEISIDKIRLQKLWAPHYWNQATGGKVPICPGGNRKDSWN